MAATINDLLDSALSEIDCRFEHEQKQWPLVQRNHAIVGRNRAMQQIGPMLGIEYHEMPLEQPEQAA